MNACSNPGTTTSRRSSLSNASWMRLRVRADPAKISCAIRPERSATPNVGAHGGSVRRLRSRPKDAVMSYRLLAKAGIADHGQYGDASAKSILANFAAMEHAVNATSEGEETSPELKSRQ